MGAGSHYPLISSHNGTGGRAPAPLPLQVLRRQDHLTRQRTGRRTFDLNADGVAQYGLIADLWPTRIARPESPLFRSAEAYLETWQRAVSHR
jgi:hypothetical protein